MRRVEDLSAELRKKRLRRVLERRDLSAVGCWYLTAVPIPTIGSRSPLDGIARSMSAPSGRRTSTRARRAARGQQRAGAETDLDGIASCYVMIADMVPPSMFF